ncbi:MAG TPA: alpha/beta hydrolase [Bacteroidales bacterium]|nr:alpha/beta hydrolase [Bacteroidales bacterium]HQI46404.1 alpha/beta hydrolase [Bacteroidales bacterium]
MEITYNNSRINYNVEGTLGNKTIVFLHGFTESLDIWDKFSTDLSIHHKVICIDLPGHGKSECIGEIHKMEEMAEVVKMVLDQESVTNCVIIGHSMGGYVSLAFAEKYSDMLKGLGLFHSSPFADTPEGKQDRARVIEVIKKNHSNFLMNFIPDLFAPDNRKKYEDEINSLIKKAVLMTGESIIAAQRGMMERKDKSNVLTEVLYPVLFIAGKMDTRIPFEKVTQMIILPKDATSLLLHDVGHMGYIESSDKTLYAVKCFVNGIL